MKLKAPENEAYAATIVNLKDTYPLENSDNLVGVRFFGYNAAVSKDYPPGLYVMFSAETQLSEEYCKKNNLFRHKHLNEDETKGGYIEDNRRIRAIRLRGNVSNCVVMPLESLAYTGVDVSQFKAGDTFDELNDHKICEKYVVPTKAQPGIKAHQPKFSRVDKRMLPEHIKTLQYFRYENQFKNKVVYVTQKLHGTSVRIAHIPVAKKLTWIERLAKKFGIAVQEQEYDYVYGSRRVIKDANADADHFYDTDIHTEVGKRLAPKDKNDSPKIPKNYILYGEIIGWINEEKPIQPGYTYNLKPGTNELYIYRIAVINPDGEMVDLSWEAVKEFCVQRNLNHVPELRVMDGIDEDAVDAFMNKRYYDEGWRNAVPLSHAKTKDEGICIRYEAQVPVIAKAKCSEFLELETKTLDKGEVDVEES